MLAVHGQYLAKIHEAVTKKPEGDALGELLKALVAGDKHNAELLQQVLSAVQKLGSR
jgi:hypothetical protein